MRCTPRPGPEEHLEPYLVGVTDCAALGTGHRLGHLLVTWRRVSVYVRRPMSFLKVEGSGCSH